MALFLRGLWTVLARGKAHLAFHNSVEWQLQLIGLEQGWWIRSIFRDRPVSIERQIPSEGWDLDKANRGAIVAPSPIILWDE